MPRSTRASVLGDLTTRTRAGWSRKVHAFGMTFDSQGEYERYLDLRDRERRGEIAGLQVHVPMKLAVDGQLVCTWIVDFRYFEPGGGLVVEDYKSQLTRRLPEYRIKVKLFQALHPGVRVVETVASRRRRPR